MAPTADQSRTGGLAVAWNRPWRPRTLRWRVYALVGGLVALLLAVAVATVVARLRVAGVDQRLSETTRPAQSAVADLTKGYVDMETGERGFLLTGDPQFPQPSQDGKAAAADARERLGRLLAADPPSSTLLAAVDAAAQQWRVDAAEPEIASARAGPLSKAQLQAMTATGKRLFDDLRDRLAQLQARTDYLAATATQQASSTQKVATTITLACAGLALLLGLLAILQVWRSLDQPVRRLVDQVGRVSQGDLDQSVDVRGLSEVDTLSGAVEAMRLRIRAEVAEAADAADRIARLEETDRIAVDLGKRVTKILFSASLAVQSTAGRHPRTSQALAEVTTQIDHALSELRLSVYGQQASHRTEPLGAQLVELVTESESLLGGPVDLRLDGDLNRELPPAVVHAVITTLQAVLSAFARTGATAPITLDVVAGDGEVRLHISGPQPGVATRAQWTALLTERAHRDGAEVAVDLDGDFFRLDLTMPLAPGTPQPSA